MSSMTGAPVDRGRDHCDEPVEGVCTGNAAVVEGLSEDNEKTFCADETAGVTRRNNIGKSILILISRTGKRPEQQKSRAGRIRYG